MSTDTDDSDIDKDKLLERIPGEETDIEDASNESFLLADLSSPNNVEIDEDEMLKRIPGEETDIEDASNDSLMLADSLCPNNVGGKRRFSDSGLKTQPSSLDVESPDIENPVSNDSSERSGLEGMTDTTDLRIIIIGKTGAGQSATGNTILGKRIFKSQMSMSSITKRCQLEMITRFNRKIIVVDTPGIYDTHMEIEEVKTEMARSVGMTVPGPHVILLTVCIGRFTNEEVYSVKHLINVFGPGITNYIIVIFTKADELKKSGQDIKDFVNYSPSSLREFLNLCNNRYIAFDNSLYGTRQEQQVKNLIGIVDEVVHKNGGFCKTNKIFEEAIQKLRILEDEMQKNVMKEKQRKREFLPHYNQMKSELKIALAKDANLLKTEGCVIM